MQNLNIDENSHVSPSNTQSENPGFSFTDEILSELDNSFSEIALSQEIRMLDLKQIKINWDTSYISARKVTELGASIEAVGLLQPIIVNEEMELVVGRHRFRAFQELGLKLIPSIVLPLDAVRQQIAELDENLVRRNLSVLERGRSLKRRKELFEYIYPETKRGCYKRDKSDKLGANENRAGFVRKTAAEFEISPRTAQRLIQIANGITDEASNLIKNHRIADNQRELAQLASLNRTAQVAVATCLVENDLATIGEGIKQLATERPDLLEHLDCGKSKKETTVEEDDNLKIVRAAKALTSLIIEAENFQTRDFCRLLNSVKLPKQTIKEWLEKVMASSNDEFDNSLNQIENKKFNRFLEV